MTTPKGAVAGHPASATVKLRAVETVTFRLVPVPAHAIAGWNSRVADWAFVA